MPLGLIALALGGFGIGLTEFVIAGLISTVATDMGVTIPTAGYLISGYALAVVVGALGLTPVLGAWRPKRALLALAVSLVAFALLSGSMAGSAAMLLAMGFFGFATVPGLQMRVLSHAEGAPTMASSANIAAFNVGNFLGVWVSGLAISAGLGWTSPLWVGAAFATLGLVVLLAATTAERRTSAREVLAPVSA
jgi:predicted MFS family arabinose efflux permease